jgi:lysophospholipase L1-like esterase
MSHHRIIILLSFGAVLLVYCATRKGSPSMAVQPAYVGKLRFLALGDSYTIGESVEPSERWPTQLAARMRGDGIDLSDPVIIARTGWTTGDLLAAMDQAKLTGKFDLVMLLIGVNNQFQGRSEEEYRQQFSELLTRAVGLAGGNVGHVVVLSIPDWSVMPFGRNFDVKRMSGEIDRFNAICREESIGAGVGYVDVTAASRGATTRPGLVAGDGLHPSGEQYGEWVEGAMGVVKEAVGR